MLSLSHVAKAYHTGGEKVDVLRDVSCEIQPGTFNVILGRSGSGKSTLLHLIAGLDRPDRGSISVNGKEIHSLSQEALAHYRLNTVGLVFQFFNLLPTLSAHENVALPSHLRGEPLEEIRARARNLLDLVQLLPKSERLPHELSGGETQRVALARALMNDPALLLADEPTGNLDRKNADGIVELFTKLVRERRTTLIVVTHDRGVAAHADQVFELEDGLLTAPAGSDPE